MKKVTVEVEEGSWLWACALHQNGCFVTIDGHRTSFDPTCVSLSETRAARWVRYVEPQKPLTVQPGTFP